MRLSASVVVVAAMSLGAPVPVLAQRSTFTRSFDVARPSLIDVTTTRGRIEIAAGEPGKVVITGIVTVKIGWDVPANAVELAEQVRSAPPIERLQDTIRLTDPDDAAARRAVFIAYQVRVPAGTEVHSVSESGATTIRGVSGPVDVRTGSAVITIDGVGSSLRIRTRSGGVTASLTGQGDVDVETGSSAVTIRGAGGGVRAATQSGSLNIAGHPRRPWAVTTSSSAVDVDVPTDAAFDVDFRSRSGDIAVPATIKGTVTKHDVKGTFNGGGPTMTIETGSGAIRLRQR